MGTPYTYLIGWSSLNTWYYGRRTHRKATPDDLWKTYFTSSKFVKEFRVKYGEPDIIQVRRVFDDNDKCKIWECRVLTKLGVPHNNKFLNKQCGSTSFDSTGRTWKNNKRFSDNQSKRQKGLVMVKDSTTGIYVGKVPVGHDNIKNGVWVGLNKGVSVGKGLKKSNGHKDSISKSTKGKPKTKTDKWNKAKEEKRFNYQRQHTCEKCGTTCTQLTYNAHHGDRCGSPSPTKGTVWCHNPSTGIRKRLHMPIPDGFILGKGAKRLN